MTTSRAVPPPPTNEPIRGYAPGTPETSSIQAELVELAGQVVDAPNIIGGREVRTGDTFEVRAPHDHGLHLADVHAAGAEDVTSAIDASLAAKGDWESMSWEDRSSIFLKAADLLAGPWRDTINASTMLGQSKTVFQAEIDAACELIDFFKFNVSFYADILAEQPISAADIWNRLDHRPLEGFVLALTPFNFTSIAANLPFAPALCGNTVIWKPSEKQAHSAHFLMQLFQAAGLPDGVINLVHGDGAMVSDVAMAHPDFAGLHFTGSTNVFKSLWRKSADNLDTYKTYPRIVGETGGKDFILAHPSAEVDTLAAAMVRGAFEYQGQKCSAASRAFVPRSLWPAVRERVRELQESIAMGDIADFSNFMGAVIDERAFVRHRDAIDEAKSSSDYDLVCGGTVDDTDGWFVSPTVLEAKTPDARLLRDELFGPILTTYVYDDWDDALRLVDTGSPYALTGAVFSQDRAAVADATSRLRHAAGNYYINDKPTGAVVGQQPFGGGRASGTNDKAGSPLNLTRWISPRSIKENFVPPTTVAYPHMG